MKTQRLSINALVKLANLALDGLIALVVVWYFVERLGAEAYGIVPWLTSLFVLFTIIPTAVQASVGRFVTAAMRGRNPAEATQHYGAGSLVLAVLGVLSLAVTAFLWWLAPAFYPFSGENLIQARLLTLLFGGAVSLEIIRGAFAIGYFAHERFDWEYGTMMGAGLLRLAIIIGLSEIFAPALRWIGYGMLIAAAARLAAGIVHQRLLAPELSFSPKWFRSSTMRPITVFATEYMLAGVGLIILNQADILVAGWLLGSAMVTIYYCGARWLFLLRAIVSAMTTVLTPRVTALQAEENPSEIARLLQRTNIVIMPFAWLIAGLLFALAEPLIIVWVGPGQRTAATILQFLAFPLAITVCAYGGIAVLTGLGKIRESSLSALYIGLINPVLSVMFVVSLGWGLLGIAAASAICLVARNGLYLPLLFKRHAGLEMRHYFRLLSISALAAVPSTALAWWIMHTIVITGWVPLIIGACVSSIPSFLTIYFGMWSEGERDLLVSIFRRR